MKNLFLGESKLHVGTNGSNGTMVDFEGEPYYCITDFDEMLPFFMTVVSGWDHWMFVSSTGGLTCGRRDPDNALFPYATDDKIHDAHATTGPVTMMRVDRDGRTCLWQPFAPGPAVYRRQRNLYKNVLGNRLVFEEVNHDLQLRFFYQWTSGECLGFIRKVALVNTAEQAVQVDVLDGLRNLMPYGIDRAMQANMSTLVDAYKQSESVDGIAAGIYSLSSILTDRAEPSEALKCTVAWSMGLGQPKVLLSEDQLAVFCAGGQLEDERFKKGKRGAFLVQDSLALPPAGGHSWYLVADVEQGPAATAGLLDAVRNHITSKSIELDVQSGTRRLRQLLGRSDAFQSTSDALVTGRHLSNTLFNIMRGGVFDDAYRLPLDDFLKFVRSWNTPLVQEFEHLLPDDVDKMPLAELLALVRATGNADMERLALEYLPLIFSRRHGDPSRPWNYFSIELRHTDGSDFLTYQGNWRDIFQNWEALALSFPGFVESFICKFVNASTADGYNAYRIGREGIDWEVFDPSDPWSNIGYWGDHQVGYLHRLLELSHRYHPGALTGLLQREVFVYADVPYRIKPYQAQMDDPRNTVEFDAGADAQARLRVDRIGSDGKLVALPDGGLLRVNLLEKLLVPALAKISNLVPGGGIWMNTQRPEWNDANNALVGLGLSMVTLCDLRRYLSRLTGLLPRDGQKFMVSGELATFFEGLNDLLEDRVELLAGPVDDRQRKQFLDQAGALAETWRSAIYAGISGAKRPIGADEVAGFLERAIAYLDHSIALNQREDGLYHAYNLAHFGATGYAVEPLEEMLEGQVAVLSSGFLDAAASLELLKNLRDSKLYRQDQNSYMLYPDRSLPLFREKNIIPAELAGDFDWLQKQTGTARTDYVEQDLDGQLHFNGRFRNAGMLREALQADGAVPADAAERLLEIFEQTFRHRNFRGRSGSMYKYEGLGCIYWHMVSKLALAVAESALDAAHAGEEQGVIEQLAEHYEAIRAGLGVHKAPAEYGAFTTDPYSHTPGFAGVQQPGLTGQVKEDVIARYCELGVVVEQGEVLFAPTLLRHSEFVSQAKHWKFSVGGEERSETLEAGSLSFCLCGVPVIYRLAESGAIRVYSQGGAVDTLSGGRLGPEFSRSLFQREGRVHKIVVDIPRSMVR
jgi:hypothetical protein